MGDVIHDLPGISELTKPGACHTGPNDLMMMKGDSPRPVLPGVGFADVMKEGSKSKYQFGTGLVDHGERVGQNVLVTLIWILLHGETVQLGQKHGRKAGRDDHRQCLGRRRRQKQLRQLVTNPLRRDDAETLSHGRPPRRLGVGLNRHA
jgi:hypothetical protein